MFVKEITPNEVKNKLKKGENLSIIDVRELEEVEMGKIAEAVHISLGEMPHRINEIDKNKQHILVCLSGSRSYSAAHYLMSLGYDVLSMRGGMSVW
ncbi:MAG: rhodanese-like domain-containing protein [Bacillaceae bacterium]|nr:rhodanese-like domain-containing protein [Bacillaceae bacterium]